MTTGVGVDLNRVRILILGDSGVGKTSFVQLLSSGKPVRQPPWTIGCTVEVKLHDYQAGTLEETPYFVEFWDVGGSQSHQHSRAIFYQPVHGIILVHDLANRKSRENLRKWLSDVWANIFTARDEYQPVRKMSAQTSEASPSAGRRSTSPISRNKPDMDIPVLVVGCKYDLVEKTGTGLIASGFPPPAPVTHECNAEEIFVNCRDSKALAAGSTNSLKLTRFFDRVTPLSSLRQIRNMKLKRLKKAQKYLAFYRQNFGLIKQPLRIFVDGTFCQAALSSKINIREQLPKYLDHSVKILTSHCVLKELEILGPQLYGALHIAKQFEILQCGHKVRLKHGFDEVVSAAKCMSFQAKSSAQPDEEKYIFATQDHDLTETLRSIPGCPILFIKYSTILLDAPSQASRDAVSLAISTRINFEGHQAETLAKVKNEVLGPSQCDLHVKKKRRGPKGPNPLSCKKKKKPTSTTSASIDTRKRNRKSHHRRGAKQAKTA